MFTGLPNLKQKKNADNDVIQKSKKKKLKGDLVNFIRGQFCLAHYICLKKNATPKVYFLNINGRYWTMKKKMKYFSEYVLTTLGKDARFLKYLQ